MQDPQPPYQPLPILTFTCTRTGKTLGIKNRFLFQLVIKTSNIRVKGVLQLNNLKIYSRDMKHIDEY